MMVASVPAIGAEYDEKVNPQVELGTFLCGIHAKLADEAVARGDFARLVGRETVRAFITAMFREHGLGEADVARAGQILAPVSQIPTPRLRQIVAMMDKGARARFEDRILAPRRRT